MSLSGRYVLLEYDVPGPRVWHERWVVQHVNKENYAIVTPDADVYIEELSILNSDIRTIRVRQGPGLVPPGVNPAEIYGLPAWGAGELARLSGLAHAEAATERARLGAGGGVGVNIGVPVVANAPVNNADASSSEAKGPGAEPVASGSLVWVAAEQVGNIRYGEIVQGVAAHATAGAKTVHVLADGQTIFCECLGPDQVTDFNNRPARCDARINAIKINAVGTPEKPLGEVASESNEFPMRWDISGPRTAKWCLHYLSVEGLGFEAHHERFRQVCKLDAAGWGVQEHFQLSMVLRQLIQVDLLNACNCLGIELMFRRVQTIEYAHSEKARELESKTVGGKLSLEEQYTFGSLVRQAGTLMICPKLLDHVKAEVQKDVELQKNMRKAREERELARRKGKKGDENP